MEFGDRVKLHSCFVASFCEDKRGIRQSWAMEKSVGVHTDEHLFY